MTIDIITLMEGLSRSRPIFHSEADFQHALAWRLHETVPEIEVRLEFRPLPQENIYIDIWIPKGRIAIELKYLTRKLLADWRGETFMLRNQAAQATKRYDFLERDRGALRTVGPSPHQDPGPPQERRDHGGSERPDDRPQGRPLGVLSGALRGRLRDPGLRHAGTRPWPRKRPWPRICTVGQVSSCPRRSRRSRRLRTASSSSDAVSG